MLEYWREIDAFKTSQKLSEGKPEYSFFDGPPFATGKPHYGHLLAGTIKVGWDDMIRDPESHSFVCSRAKWKDERRDDL